MSRAESPSVVGQMVSLKVLHICIDSTAECYMGPIPIRRELRDLEKNYPDQWNLYILALADFQNVPESEQLSYYGIAGE